MMDIKDFPATRQRRKEARPQELLGAALSRTVAERGCPLTTCASASRKINAKKIA